MFCSDHVPLAKRLIFFLWHHLLYITTPLCTIPSQIPSNQFSIVSICFLRTYLFFPFIFPERSWERGSSILLPGQRVSQSLQGQSWADEDIDIGLSFRHVLSLTRGEVDLFIAQLLFIPNIIEVCTFLQLKGLILGFSFLKIFQPNLLKLFYLLLLFFFSFHDLSFSYKILASSSLCLVFKHSGNACSYHSTQSMRTDS